jgi:protein-histidine N-methyltransferase
LLRRDLFDARFQLISQDQASDESNGEYRDGGKGKGKGKGKEKEEFVDAATDLIPGLYEGGLKTWEGGVDLVEVLSEGLAVDSDWLNGKSVLEVCPITLSAHH